MSRRLFIGHHQWSGPVRGPCSFGPEWVATWLELRQAPHTYASYTAHFSLAVEGSILSENCSVRPGDLDGGSRTPQGGMLLTMSPPPRHPVNQKRLISNFEPCMLWPWTSETSLRFFKVPGAPAQNFATPKPLKHFKRATICCKRPLRGPNGFKRSYKGLKGWKNRPQTALAA